jgi:diguanylate cyclase (GGDEF)-like protein/PAS domain S-box-containing protein
LVDMSLAGQGWTLWVTSLPAFERGVDRSAEGVILGSGAIISALLFAITLSLATTRKRAVHLARRYTRELDDERRRLREITTTMGEGLYVQDRRDRITFVNPAAEQLLGWRRDEFIGMSSRRLIPRNGDGTGSHQRALERARSVGNGRFAPERAEFLRKDGRTLPVSVVSTPILRDGKAEGSVVVFQDLRERVAVEEALRATEQFKALFEYASEAMFLSDAAGNILDVNRVGCVNLGYAREELIGQPPTLFVHWLTLPGSSEEQCFDRLVAQLRKGEIVMAEAELIRKDGTRYPAEASFSGINHGGQYRILVSARDISQRKEAERHVAEALAAVERSRAEMEDINRRLAESNRELQRLSRRDGLTGIANRRHFDEYLELEWRRAERDGRPLSLLIADVDHFKAFNDVYGHQAGDECLRRIAHTIDAQLSRSIDVTARYGGEEFAVILPETPLAGALNIAERMRGAVMGLRIRHEASPVSEFVTVSIGAASVIPRRGETPERLIGAADQALYEAKQGGRNRVCPAR